MSGTSSLPAAAVAVLFAGALVCLLASRRRTLCGWLAFAATASAAALAASAGVSVLASGTPVDTVYLPLPAFGSLLRLYVDGLSAVFVGLIAVVSTLAALYSVAYTRHHRDYSVARYYPNVLLFVAGMYLVVTITDLGIVFCLTWQLMTVPSFFLVRFEYRKRENVRAAWRYLAMMEIACAAVLLASRIVARYVSAPRDMRYDFDVLGQGVSVLLANDGLTAALVFLLFLIGFGIKAGMWPFGQLWLPDAHPAAPSPVSALLSGVMIKTGVYGLMRTFLWLVPVWAVSDFPTREWGFVIAALGTVTLFVGTMQALKQEVTKRLLAFHSIGQIGYILLGLGACLALLEPARRSPGMTTVFIIAFVGALYHTINHATFKSLLFFNAGSMLHATDTQDLNRLGGLMRYMPVTAVTALVASCSIAGVPGFSGFASKWSLYVATILTGGSARYLPLFGLVAILTSALTLASFLKFFGMAFLTRTSRLVAAKAEGGPLEPGPAMLIPQVVLALACVALGLFPAWAYEVMAAALRASPQGLGALLAQPQALPIGEAFGISSGSALLSPLLCVATLVLLAALARTIAHLGRAPRRPASPWLCGYATEAESNRYVAHGLYGEVKRYFTWLGGTPRKGEE